MAPHIAVCVHPGPLDLLMVSALRRIGVPFVALVHDADPHPGDGLPFQILLQRMVYRRAAALGTFTRHVANRIRVQRLAGAGACPLIHLALPPISFSLPPRTERYGNAVHLLMFGRLLEYKGLDLLADALRRLGARKELVVRVVGRGPDGASLRALRAMPGVTVENRWVSEDEIGELLGWSDAVILPYREASQSGVAAAAQAAGRFVVATRVGGLPEQLSGYPRALLCEPQVESIVDALRHLLEQRRPLGEPSAEASSEAWREMATSPMLWQILRSICAPPPSAERRSETSCFIDCKFELARSQP